MPPLKIVADGHIWGVREAFAALPGFDVDLEILEKQQITRERLLEADILLTRSATRVDESLLSGTRVRFAGTATIGDDHYDKTWLDRQGIAWCNAAGSSTGSVVEYMLAVLLELHVRRTLSIPETTMGVIGVGRIGASLAERCSALGMPLLLNDPPRQRGGEEGLVDLATLLSDADVITLHTPLIHEGTDRTWHLVDESFLSRFRGKGIINAARGACVDSSALNRWLDEDPSHWAALDCWEGEPDIPRSLLAHPQLLIATPHIAGHSLDGKCANTESVYGALCRFLGITPEWRAEQALPVDDVIRMKVTATDPWQGLAEVIHRLYPLMRDVEIMRQWLMLGGQEVAASFSEFRRHYPVRRGWDRMAVQLQAANGEVIRLAKKSGINVVGSSYES